MSYRTKSLKQKKMIFLIISLALWIGTTCVLIFSALKFIGTKDTEDVEHAISITFGTGIKTAVASLSVTALIGIVASIMIRDKIRVFIYMLDVILSALLFDRTGMIIVLSIWFIDEYIIFNIYKHLKNKVTINKELDLRE